MMRNMMNDTLTERIMYMDNIVSMLTQEVFSVFNEAIVEEDEEDFLLAHLLNEKTVDLTFILLDIVREELDELQELETAWHKDNYSPMLNSDGNISIGGSSEAKSENGWDTEVLSSSEDADEEEDGEDGGSM
jgi:hypothetical protein